MILRLVHRLLLDCAPSLKTTLCLLHTCEFEIRVWEERAMKKLLGPLIVGRCLYPIVHFGAAAVSLQFEAPDGPA